MRASATILVGVVLLTLPAAADTPNRSKLQQAIKAAHGQNLKRLARR